MDAHRLKLVLAHGSERQVAVRRQSDRRPVGGINRILGGSVIGDDRLDIGDILQPEQRQVLVRDIP